MTKMAELAADLEKMGTADLGPDDCEPMICGCCNGSGEGRTDGSTCGACRGSGEFRDLEAEREREAERADYLYDQAKDRDLERALDNECYPDDDLPF